MILNLWIAAGIGSIPLLGDLFDVGWKANIRNVALMERAMVYPEASKRSSLFLLIGLGIASLLIFAVMVGLILWAFGITR